MKKVLVFLCTLILLVTCVVSFAASESAEPNERNMVQKNVTLKRGKTVEAWVFPFASVTEVYLPDKGEDQVTVKSIKLSGAKGNVTVAGATSWLKATVVSNKQIMLAVSGKNTSPSDKVCTLKVKDSKGEFGTIKITRGGIIKFTSIKQSGKKIKLKIKAATHNLANSYMRRIVFDKNGNVVSRDYLGTYGKTTVVDSEVKLQKGYTVTYSVGYFNPSINCSWSCYAAAIKIKKTSGSATGKTKTCINDDQLSFNDEWLYSIVN